MDHRREGETGALVSRLGGNAEEHPRACAIVGEVAQEKVGAERGGLVFDKQFVGDPI
jgi:hypothetical protein